MLRNIGPLGCDCTDWFVSDMVLNPEFSCISSLSENTLYAWCFYSYKPGVPFMGAFMRRPVWGYCLLREFIEKLNEMLKSLTPLKMKVTRLNDNDWKIHSLKIG